MPQEEVPLPAAFQQGLLQEQLPHLPRTQLSVCSRVFEKIGEGLGLAVGPAVAAGVNVELAV